MIVTCAQLMFNVEVLLCCHPSSNLPQDVPLPLTFEETHPITVESAMSTKPLISAFSNATTLRATMADIQEAIVAGILHGNLVATMPGHDTTIVSFLKTILGVLP